MKPKFATHCASCGRYGGPLYGVQKIDVRGYTFLRWLCSKCWVKWEAPKRQLGLPW